MKNQTPTTGIPVNQPYSRGPQYTSPMAPGTGTWSSGLFDCFDDVPRCLLTCVCPCVTFGQVAETVDNGSSSCMMTGGIYALLMAFTGCQCIYSCIYRKKMRQEYGIAGSEMGDCCTHFCCECCALTQLSRELTARGYDIPLGWLGNNSGMQNQGVQMAPTAPGGMSR